MRTYIKANLPVAVETLDGGSSHAGCMDVGSFLISAEPEILTVECQKGNCLERHAG